MRALDVWFYGTHIATIREERDDRLVLDWTSDARERWSPGTRMLSAKLPIGDPPIPPLTRAYLEGLLPEGNARTNHAMSAGVAPDDTFGLVRAYGRDTPGAAILVPEGAPDPTCEGRYEPITTDELTERLRTADRHSPASPQSIGESSTLPGMIPKIVLHRDVHGWLVPKDGAASTWIIKRGAPVDSAIADVVDTEAACLDLAGRIGLTTVEAEVLELGDLRAIAVSRYDRVSGADPRVHQEDLAQAIALNTSDPNRKFQWGSRMPSLRHGADALRLDGRPDQLLRLATFTYLVGNTDMHAKNISFIRDSDGVATLAPAYDIAMHLHHDRDNRRFALDVNGKYEVGDVTVTDLVAEGRSWGLPERRARRAVQETVVALDDALGAVDRGRHAGVSARAWAVVEERVATAQSAL